MAKSTEIKNPQKALLVTATACGDCIADVVGYYHFDTETQTHYVCDEKSLIRYEVLPETIKFANYEQGNNH